MRERVAGEIIPVEAEQSATKHNDKVNYGAGRAVDMDLETPNWVVPESDGTTWLQIILGKVNCVRRVIWYHSDSNPHHNWTCTKSDCSSCMGSYCSDYTLAVSTEGAALDLYPVSDCRFGDTVKLERVSVEFKVYEIAVIGKEGNSTLDALQFNALIYLYLYLSHDTQAFTVILKWLLEDSRSFNGDTPHLTLNHGFPVIPLSRPKKIA